MIDMIEIQKEISGIVANYLNQIESSGSHNHFMQKADNNTLALARNVGFSMLYEDIDNYFVVQEELFLEGCTRVFLINPIMKQLLDAHYIKNEWMFDTTFGNFTVSNRECEAGNYIQFIAVLDGKKVGVRYTEQSYSMNETAIMERDFQYSYGNKRIPGFDKLSPVDYVITLDWTGVLKPKEYPDGMRGQQIFSIADFFTAYFSNEEYEMVITESKKAIKRAKEIIALRAIPQLLPNNIYSFKHTVLNEFSKETLAEREYEFEDGISKGFLCEKDKQIVEKNFAVLQEAIIGNNEFAKCFITSEYLYKSIKEGLSIDYTAVVVGYLKAVEQLLYLYYISAFENSDKLNCWDKCRRKNVDRFDPEKPNYRYDPYDDIEKGEERRKQELYLHYKKTGNNALEIGGLVLFLRYYEKMWAVSESGKEYIYKCLDDYRKYCRNSFFHKDNIGCNQYATVTRIRNNTQVCLYYLLGAFKLLDGNTVEKEQLGILDNRLAKLYYYTHYLKKYIFKAKLTDGSEVILHYKRDITDFKFNEFGELISGSFKFIRLNNDTERLSFSYIKKVFDDEEYIKNNTICFSESNIPLEITPLAFRKHRH